MSRDRRGTIEKHVGARGTTYRIRVTIGIDPRGRQIRRRATVRGTKVDAERRLTEMLRQIDEGVYVDPTSVTVRQYLEDWMAHNKAKSLSPSTLRGYRGIVDRYLVPAIGTVPLQKLAPIQIERMYSELLTSGRTKGVGEGLGARTVLHVHRVLRAALKRAVRMRLLQSNPADAVEPPHPREREMHALNEDQAAEMLRLLSESVNASLRAIVAVALYTGMRRSELLALRWADVDLVTRTVAIRRKLVYTKDDGLVFGEPKTAKSRRTIGLPLEAIEELKTHRSRQAAERLLLGPAYRDQDLVFAASTGGPLKPDTISLAFRSFAKKHGIPIRFHDLRHTHATLLFKNGEPVRVIADRLGHASAVMTLNTYAHALEGQDTDAADRLGRLIKDAKGASRTAKESQPSSS